MNRIIMLIIFFICCAKGYGQVIVKDTLPPSFEWSLHLAEFPYMADAAKAEAIRDKDGNALLNATVQARHYGKSYRNLSMAQATDMSRNLHGSLYYGHNVLWNKLVRPAQKNIFLTGCWPILQHSVQITWPLSCLTAMLFSMKNFTGR